jgi:hypothetical protein
MRKKWWLVSLLASVAWIVLILGTAVVHSAISTTPTTEAEDAAISERYGQVAGGGTALIWMALFAGHVGRKKKPAGAGTPP